MEQIDIINNYDSLWEIADLAFEQLKKEQLDNCEFHDVLVVPDHDENFQPTVYLMYKMFFKNKDDIKELLMMGKLSGFELIYSEIKELDYQTYVKEKRRITHDYPDMLKALQSLSGINND